MACTTCSSGGGCSTSKVGGCGSKGGCSSGGCTRLNVFDWLADVDLPSDFRGFDCVEIRFKGGRKEFFRNDQRLPLVTGDAVVVEAAGSGWHLGHVSLKGELVRLQMRKKKVPTDSRDIRPILRVATPDDEERWQAVRDLENGTMFRARAVVDELRLKMKLSDVEYQADRTRALFYYSAEDRVDFRELIRRLADEFRVRVEMRQISLRQEAGRIGGIGVCGRELCCSTWLTDFKAVSTTAARYQNLSLNPQKLAGQCGRLKCCLNYELDAYLDALKDIPQVQRPLQLAGGEAFLQKTDIFRKRMWFAFRGDNNWVMVSAERVREVLEMNKRGEKPDNLLPPRQEIEVVPAVSTLMEGDLDRLDDQIKAGNKRGKRKRKERPGGPEASAPTPPEPREPREPREAREPREGREPRRRERPEGSRPPRPEGLPRADNPPTPPAPAEGPGAPTPEGAAEPRGRRGAAARPLNRRGGRNREGGDPSGSLRDPTQEARPRRGEPAADNPTPRPPREGGEEPRPEGSTGRNRGRRGGSGRRGAEGSDNAAAPTPPAQPNPMQLFTPTRRPAPWWLTLLPLAAALSACDPNTVYEENVDLKSPSGDPYVWDVQQRPTFTFTIADTAARYNVYFDVRNASGYGFYNLYLKHTLTGPAGRPAGPALLHQMTLLDPKTGQPLGAGAGDIFDHQFLALPRQHFARPGTYKLTLEQYMRQNQLPGIMSVGVRVAKIAEGK